VQNPSTGIQVLVTQKIRDSDTIFERSQRALTTSNDALVRSAKIITRSQALTQRMGGIPGTSWHD